MKSYFSINIFYHNKIGVNNTIRFAHLIVLFSYWSSLGIPLHCLVVVVNEKIYKLKNFQAWLKCIILQRLNCAQLKQCCCKERKPCSLYLADMASRLMHQCKTTDIFWQKHIKKISMWRQRSFPQREKCPQQSCDLLTSSAMMTLPPGLKMNWQEKEGTAPVGSFCRHIRQNSRTSLGTTTSTEAERILK